MQEAVERGKERAASVGTGGGGSLRGMKWKPGEKKIIRFVHHSDHFITAHFYNGVICNDGSVRTFIFDPRRGDLVAKYRAAAAAVGSTIGMMREYGSNALKEPETREQTIGIAVVRKERLVAGTTGAQTEVVDDEYYETVENQQLPARLFGLVQQSESNFWSHIAGIARRYGDPCTYDIEIIRTGQKDYSMVPFPAVDALRDPGTVEQFYGYQCDQHVPPGQSRPPWNNEDPQRFLFCPRTLDDWADYFGSEQWIRKWFRQWIWKRFRYRHYM